MHVLSFYSLILTLTFMLPSEAASGFGGMRRQKGTFHRRGMVADRGLPITATTTVTVDMTTTQTIWAVETGAQVVIAVPTMGNSSISANSTGSYSATSSYPTSSQASVTSAPSSSAPSALGSSSSSSSSDSASAVESLTEQQAPTSTGTTASYPSSSFASEVTASSSSASLVPSSSAGSAQSSMIQDSTSVSQTVSTSSSALDESPLPTISVTASSTASTVSASASILTVEDVTTSSTQSVTASATLSAASSIITSLNSTTLSASTTATSTSSSASASASAGYGGSGLSTRVLSNVMMAAYYPDWSAWELPPSAVDWTKFDCLDFAFALPDANFALAFTQSDSTTSLTNLVSYGHAAGKLVRLSIGGWTGSVYFSTAVSTAANRQTFVNNIAAVYAEFNLDGIDIDWEYPGVQGSADNIVSSTDSANFLLFLQLLRATLPSDAVLSAATQVWPFASSNGNPMTDVSGFAAILDWVLVMNYDIWGSSNTPGPNAPLSNGCSNSLQPLANAYAAISSWTNAGMPPKQIMLGIPAYGYIQKSTASALVDRRRHIISARTSITVQNANGGTTDGQIDFNAIVSQGALTSDTSGYYVGAGGFTREWDSCSSTPWLKSVASGQVITYDDPDSLSLKAQFAAQAGLRGCNMWEISGDTASWALTSAVRSGLGI